MSLGDSKNNLESQYKKAFWTHPCLFLMHRKKKHYHLKIIAKSSVVWVGHIFSFSFAQSRTNTGDEKNRTLFRVSNIL